MSSIIHSDNTESVLKRKNDAVYRTLTAIGLLAEKYAKMECPVDTGRLRNSISNAVDGDTVYVGTNVEYAPEVELGTYKMPSRPFIRPSLADHIQEYEQIFRNILSNA